VKVIIFLTFWQGLTIAFMVKMGIIKDSKFGIQKASVFTDSKLKKESNYSANNVALALQDFLLCIEMPFFAILHAYAFPWTDYDDSRLSSRVPLPHAVRDALGIKDIIQDAYHTFARTPVIRRRRMANTDPWGDLEDDFNETSFLQGSHGYYLNQDSVSDVCSLEFPDEEDSDTEKDYQQSRLLEFGDCNFPVLHADPRFAHPPSVQIRLRSQAQDFNDKVRNSSLEELSKNKVPLQFRSPQQSSSSVPQLSE
jgi:hypothetical protein